MMNNTILPTFQSVSELLGWTILHSIWQITLIALVLKLLLSWTSKHAANVRYVLSISALFAIVAWSTYTLLEGTPQNIFLEKAAANSNTENIAAKDLFQSTNALATATFFQKVSTQIIATVAPFVPSLAMLWLLGIVFFASRVVTGLFRLHRLSRVGIQTFPASWTNRLTKLKKLSGINRTIDIRLSNIVSVPITYRFFRPIVLLPFSMFTHLSDEQIEVLLLHELAHIKRHDYLFNLLQSCIEVVFFYHPLLWWISKNVRSEREHCCDDMVMQIRHQPMLYAQTLTQIQVQHYSFKTTLAMSAKENTGAFSQRIYRLFPQKDANSKVRNGVAALLLLLLSVGAMAFYPSPATPLINKKASIISQDTLPPSTQKQATLDAIEKEKMAKQEKEEAMLREKVVLKEKLATLEKTLDENSKAIEKEKGQDPLKLEELELKNSMLKKEFKEHAKTLKSLSKSDHKSSSNTFEKERLSIKLVDHKTPKVLLDNAPYTKYKITPERELILAIPTDEIATINVTKSEDANHGDVVEIYSKKYAAKAKSEEIEKAKIEENNFAIQETTTDKKPLMVLNGKVLPKGATSSKKIEDLDPNEIAHINVLKGAKAMEKYGDEGINGVVQIYTKGNAPSENSKKKEQEVILKGSASKSKIKKEEQELNKTVDKLFQKSPLYIWDGEKMPIIKEGEKNMVKIDSDKIESINVVKGQAAIDKYGEDGKNGVIEITSKKQAKKTAKAAKASKKQQVKKEKKKFKEEKEQKKEQQKKEEKVKLKAKMVKPTNYGLSVFPNPTIKLTNIQLNLEEKGKVRVDIINVNGQLVLNLVNEMLDTGFHEYQWNSDDQPAGNYFVHFNMDGALISKQVIVKK